jgi:PhzF family phenazine biosynthesis protein
MRAFRQVDVFSRERYLGNPVAVVQDADGLSDAEMAAFARWTNLSETTFLLTPTVAAADYRLRIFTPGGELPFAGHPTLGTAHAWLEAGGKPRGEQIIQECPAGLVPLRREAGRLAFAAPPLVRDEPVDDELLARLTAPLGLKPADVVAARWCDNGPGWVALRLASAREVLELTPDFGALRYMTGLVGLYPQGEGPDGGLVAAEVRALCTPDIGITEDPVTGSLNAGLGQWLAGTVLPASYVAAQGTGLGRRGRVHIDRAADGTVWVGGDTHTTIVGTVSL